MAVLITKQILNAFQFNYIGLMHMCGFTFPIDGLRWWDACDHYWQYARKQKTACNKKTAEEKYTCRNSGKTKELKDYFERTVWCTRQNSCRL